MFLQCVVMGKLEMRMRGFEPPQGCPHWHLKPARLPIPPHPQQESDIKDFMRKVKRFLLF